MKRTGIYEGRVLNLAAYEGVLNGRAVRREIVEHRGAAAVLAFDGDGRVVLVRQERFPHGEILEIPAGTLEEGEDPTGCASRELGEETGYAVESISPLISYYPSVGYSTEIIHCFVASVRPSGRGPSPDDDESITVVRMDWGRLLRMVRSGEVRDSKTICSVLAHAAAKD